MEKSAVKFLWHYVRQFKWFFIFMLFCLIISQSSGQVYPYFVAKIFDTAASQTASPTYWEDLVRLTLIGFAFGLIKSPVMNALFHYG